MMSTEAMNQTSLTVPNTSKPAPATADDTRRALLERSHRVFVPIPKPFIQQPPHPGLTDRRGPLAEFVTRRDVRALKALLLLHAVTSSGAGPDGWSTTLALPVWARAFDTVTTAQGPAANSGASKILTRLEKRRLITRQHAGSSRKVRVTLLAADGSGGKYTRPTGLTADDRFLKLSHRFWLDGWDKRLSLPGLAMLLVALHERPTFSLATEHMPEWYGWSADTAERGFAELCDLKILSVTRRWRSEPLAPEGLTFYNEYTIEPPFDSATLQADEEGTSGEADH